MDCSVTDLMTVRVGLELTTLPNDAEICDVPAPTPVAMPVFAPTVATVVLEELQTTLVVMSFELPSL